MESTLALRSLVSRVPNAGRVGAFLLLERVEVLHPQGAGFRSQMPLKGIMESPPEKERGLGGLLLLENVEDTPPQKP